MEDPKATPPAKTLTLEDIGVYLEFEGCATCGPDGCHCTLHDENENPRHIHLWSDVDGTMFTLTFTDFNPGYESKDFKSEHDVACFLQKNFPEFRCQ